MIKSDLLFPKCLRIANFNSPRKIMVGLDSNNMLGSELNFEEGKKILIVTDEGVRNAG
jgi:alcohol dehydrogenase class IV